MRARALGALYGLAIGDALGMPTQSRSRADIVARYGSLLAGFEPGPPDHPLAAGLPAGTVTDDTEQAVLLARLVIEGRGAPDPAELASQLLAWEESMRARGSLDLLGPSTRRALGAVAAGASIEDSGRFGTTNGAAMRITPVGIATPSGDHGLLVDRVVAASRVTHNTGIALAGAAAVAAAVSAGIDGATVGDAVQIAAAAAASAAQLGHWAAGADVATRIIWAAGLVAGLVPEAAMDVVYRLVGSAWPPRNRCPRRSRWRRRAWATRGSPAGWPPRWAVTATRSPPWPARSAVPATGGRRSRRTRGSTVARVNNLGLEGLAAGLLAVRAGAAAQPGGDAPG